MIARVPTQGGAPPNSAPLLPPSGGAVGTRTWPRPDRRTPAQALQQARDSTGMARVAIALGVAGLPILRPTVAGNVGPADAAIFLGIAGTLLWAGVSQQVLRAAYLGPTTLLVLAGILAGLSGTQPTAALLAIAQDIYLVVWAIACVNFARHAETASFLVKAWCATSFAWALALFLVVGRSALQTGNGDSRLAFTADTNGAGLYFVLSMFVIIAARWPRRRAWRLTALTFLLLDTVLTGSLGALSGLLAGLAVGVVLGVLARRGPAPAVALVLAFALGTASVALYAQRYRLVDAAHRSSITVLKNSFGREAQSSGERRQLTAETLGLVTTRTNPLGSGPNTTEQLLRDEQAPYPKQAHNDWIAAYVERGSLGLLAVVALAFEVGRRALAIRDSSDLSEAYAPALPAVHYLMGGVVTLVVFSLSHEVLHDRTAWTLLGLIAAYAIFGRRPSGHQIGGKSCVQS